MNFEELNDAVISWGDDLGILDGSDPIKQFSKTLEEVSELFSALVQDDKSEIIDGLGDTVVTLILVAEMKGLDLVGCLESAYDIISKRTGNMVNGVFVKDGK